MTALFREGKGPRLRVFLADDSNVVVERLTTLLAELPQVELVGRAADLPGAVRGIRSLLPDAVIVDLHMPGGTGIEVIDAAKRFRAATMVIVLTNSPYPRYRAKCQAAGADAFLDKSTQFELVPQALLEMSEGFRNTTGAAAISEGVHAKPAWRVSGRPPEALGRGERRERTRDSRRARPPPRGRSAWRAFRRVPALPSAEAELHQG